jgi:hypothetical protein
MIEEDKPPIELEPIDGIIFTLIEKTVLSNEYVVVRIHSANSITREILADFWVYASNSELGFWRLCSSDPGVPGDPAYPADPTRMYKGDPDIFNYDYIQTTFIHLMLQHYINVYFKDINEIKDIITSGIENNEENKDKIEINTINVESHNLLSYFDENTNKWFVLCNPLSEEYKAIVDSRDRIIEEPPFIQAYNESKCGEPGDIQQLKLFSDKFQQTYKNPIISTIQPYKYTFEKIIEVTGNIICAKLERKIILAGYYTNIIQLYYLDAKLQPLCNKKAKYFKNINSVCSETEHYMPFLLIPFNTIINILGLYVKYILVGAYICKLFDYARQCSIIENKLRQCTTDYTHIGYRFANLFPFDYIKQLEQSHLEQSQIKTKETKKRSRGITKKGNQNKRKTRKQQKKEIDKKERNKRKERRSKNKNKSKKYGARFM